LTGDCVIVIDPRCWAITGHGIDGRNLELGFERNRWETNHGQRLHSEQRQVQLVRVLAPAGCPPQLSNDCQLANPVTMRHAVALRVLSLEEHTFLVAVRTGRRVERIQHTIEVQEQHRYDVIHGP
jgi:hypothetical protein